MGGYDVNVKLKTYWQFKNHTHLKITKDKKIVNEKTGRILVYGKRGFRIGKKHYKRDQLHDMIELIPKEDKPPF